MGLAVVTDQLTFPINTKTGIEQLISFNQRIASCYDVDVVLFRTSGKFLEKFGVQLFPDIASVFFGRIGIVKFRQANAVYFLIAPKTFFDQTQGAHQIIVFIVCNAHLDTHYADFSFHGKFPQFFKSVVIDIVNCLTI